MLYILTQTLFVLLPLSLISTTYLYSYPVFHNCAFPLPGVPADTSSWSRFKSFTYNRSSPIPDPAPFRLLALGDPQLEGDSSLLNLEGGYFPSVHELWSNLQDAHTTNECIQVIRSLTRGLILPDVLRILQSWRKRLDLVGNDYYLAHIYRTMYRYTRPTHTTVLGDLLGSQWVSDKEFENRGWRFWNRVFKDGERVKDEVTGAIHVGKLVQDNSWERRIINIAGNHDIGYAGDMSAERIGRFERVFGRANWETRFTLAQNHTVGLECLDIASSQELRIMVLNSLNLDTPALDTDLQRATYQFINDAIGASCPVEDRTTATVLLTHLPLPKDKGLCVDGPHFDFYSEEEGGGLKEQNHLSYNAGKGILEGIFGMSGNIDAPGNGFGRNGIILTGHDHEGCDVYHHLPHDENQEARVWKAERWSNAGSIRNETIPGLREITVRSMMGEFGGNAGLLSAWFDEDTREWQFSYSTCSLGVQHIWWSVHILDMAVIVLILAAAWPWIRSLRMADRVGESVNGMVGNSEGTRGPVKTCEPSDSNRMNIKIGSHDLEIPTIGHARRRQHRQ